jgi:hypothetical protein
MMKMPAQFNFEDGVPILLENVKVAYCSMVEPDTKGKYGASWKIAIYLTQEEAAWMQQVGMGLEKKARPEMKKDAAGNKVPTGEFLLYLETKCLSPDGQPNRKPDYLCADGRTPFYHECGKGSIVNVSTFLKKTDQGFPWYLNQVQVVGYVPATKSSFVDLTANPSALPEMAEGMVLATPSMAGEAPAGQAAPVVQSTPGQATAGMAPAQAPAQAAPAGMVPAQAPTGVIMPPSQGDDNYPPF